MRTKEDALNDKFKNKKQPIKNGFKDKQDGAVRAEEQKKKKKEGWI